MKLIATLAVTALSLVAVACGSDSASDATDATMPPPTVTSPPSGPPVTDAPVVGPVLPARPIEVDDGAFESIEDLGASADQIVIGTVTDEASLGRPRATTDPSTGEFLGLTISVESVLKGEPIAEVFLAWDAYAVDAHGARVAMNVMNGVPVPRPGDQLLLFLRPVDGQFASLLGGFPTHTPVALDGIGFVEAGAIAISDNTSQGAAHLTDMTVDQITGLL